jgi:hypothetical protein
MKPDRSNYEIWLSEWLEGQLTGQEAEQFRKFMAENPDLKEEIENLSAFYLVPGSIPCPRKSRLKKTAADLPLAQIEYLSVAYLERDITPEQKDDLMEKIHQDSESGILFDSVQKIKLVPPTVEYRNKAQLKKSLPVVRVIRLSLIGLSAAATIALIILSFIAGPRLLRGNKEDIAVNNITPVEPFIVKTQVIKSQSDQIPDPEILSEAPVISVPEVIAPLTGNSSLIAAAADSSSVLSPFPDLRIYSLPRFNIDLNAEISKYSLVASTIDIKEASYEDERNRLSKFIARTFRERILKEEPGSDAPVKSYEIAAAGIDGLNWLFGWEMSLTAINNEEGDLKSIYFSSRNLKFNAPVKKTDTSE